MIITFRVYFRRHSRPELTAAREEDVAAESIHKAIEKALKQTKARGDAFVLCRLNDPVDYSKQGFFVSDVRVIGVTGVRPSTNKNSNE